MTLSINGKTYNADELIAYHKRLEKENAELKSGCGMCYRKDKESLTKAKELIKSLCEMVRELNKPNVQLTDVDYSLTEAEQFIKDSKVKK